MPTVFVLKGPNPNPFGTREPEIYGSNTLADIRAMVEGRAVELGLAIDFARPIAKACSSTGRTMYFQGAWGVTGRRRTYCADERNVLRCLYGTR